MFSEEFDNLMIDYYKNENDRILIYIIIEMIKHALSIASKNILITTKTKYFYPLSAARLYWCSDTKVDNLNKKPYLDDKFVYYQEIAQKLNMNIPKINEQLNIHEKQHYWLIGYEKIIKPKLQASENYEQNIEQNKQNNEISQKQIVEYQEKPGHREQLSGSQMKDAAIQLEMDLVLLNQQQKQYSLALIRQKIYRKYYFSKVFQANSTSKKYKQIRIPENIAENDLKTKSQKIMQMIKEGSAKKIRIITQNQSENCEQNIKKMCKLLKKNTEDIKAEEEVIQQKMRKKPKITVQRFVIWLNYQEEISIDYNKVNKKWRKSLISQKNKLKGQKTPQYFKILDKMPLDVQREIIAELRLKKSPLPQAFKDYGILQDALEKGPQHFYAIAFSKSRQNNTPPQEPISQNNQIFSQKQNRKYLNIRTVNDILEDMQKISNNKHELDAFETYRMQKLQKELKQALQIAGYNKNI